MQIMHYVEADWVLTAFFVLSGTFILALLSFIAVSGWVLPED